MGGERLARRNDSESWEGPIELKTLLSDFAEALRQVDAARPQHTTKKGRAYQPWIGPHSEDVRQYLRAQHRRSASFPWIWSLSEAAGFNDKYRSNASLAAQSWFTTLRCPW